ncbi:MAG: glycosyltransferase family 4 protein [Bacteroidales bacterium]|nr:glycosyltransferase family 4 protein [Bacteroidales bacterium]
MRILIVHNDYGRYSGEEAVVDRSILNMRQMGHDVETLRLSSKFFRHSLLGQVKAYVSGLYSVEGVAMMREAMRSFKPDIVNVHNLYPFISPASLKECRKAGVPVIMTVHNYRLICPTGLFLHDGQTCEECLVAHNERPCLRHNCEGNFFRSLAYAQRNKVARRRRYYLDNVDYYICLTHFQRQKLIDFGYPANRIVIIPNYPNINTRDIGSANKFKHAIPNNFIGYVGRFSHEKGYDLLLEVARRHPEMEFLFAGDYGEHKPHTDCKNVRFCGQLDKQELSLLYRQSAFIVIPSRCYEGFPLAMLEAFDHGKACIAPNHGAFPELIMNGDKPCGVLFTPGNVDSLEQAVLSLHRNSNLLNQLNAHAKALVELRFARESINAQWEELLRKVAGKP